MAIISRRELEGYFKNGEKPSEKHFADLIASLINKRDDQFFGKWRQGVTYRSGDVVIYNRALWMLKFKDGVPLEICSHQVPADDKDNEWETLIVPIEDKDWKYFEGTGLMYAIEDKKVGIGTTQPAGKLDLIDENQGRFLFLPSIATTPREENDNVAHTYPLCSIIKYSPDTHKKYLLTGIDKENTIWLTNAEGGFVFKKGAPLEGHESEQTMDNGSLLMIVKPVSDNLVNVGIGTATPRAMLDVTDGKRGQFLLSPEEKRDPAFTIINLDPKYDKNYMAMGVGKKHAVWVSDAPEGFILSRGKEYGKYCSEEDINQGDLLMIVQQDTTDKQPRAGIGTATPAAVLELVAGDNSGMLLLPKGQQPALCILNLNENNFYASIGTDDLKRAALVSNAPEGLAFKVGGKFGVDGNEVNINQGTVQFVVKADGRVGIGTEDPSAKTEITNNYSGKFLFNLDKKVNPALGIVNTRPGSRENYLVLGADNDSAIFVTDSDQGFIFKKGGESGQKDHEVDINQGEGMLYIRPEGKGKVGIGKWPNEYELDVVGQIRAACLFLDTDNTRIKVTQPLVDALSGIERLKPVKFQWNKDLGFSNPDEQIGFVAHEVDDVFPQVVVTNKDGTKAVAYQNLVPVLVKGINELRDIIKVQKERIDNLEQKMKDMEARMTKRMDQLENRIRRCEG